LCERVGTARQAYYQGARRRRRREVDEEAVVELVKRERRIHPRMGAKKLMRMLRGELKEMGIQIGRDRFFELLRAKELLVKRRRRGGARTTWSGHGLRVYANRVKWIEPSMPDQVWVSDITYLRTEEGFLYLALITDAYSRKILGFEASDRLEAEGCLRSLRRALEGLSEGACPIHHSDRGIQYCSEEYVGLLEGRGLQISMTELNHCYENALAERVNGILKQEYGLGQTFRTKAQARQAVRQAVEIYNELRPHQSLGYRTPASVHGMQRAA